MTKQFSPRDLPEDRFPLFHQGTYKNRWAIGLAHKWLSKTHEKVRVMGFKLGSPNISIGEKGDYLEKYVRVPQHVLTRSRYVDMSVSVLPPNCYTSTDIFVSAWGDCYIDIKELKDLSDLYFDLVGFQLRSFKTYSSPSFEYYEDFNKDDRHLTPLMKKLIQGKGKLESKPKSFSDWDWSDLE